MDFTNADINPYWVTPPMCPNCLVNMTSICLTAAQLKDDPKEDDGTLRDYLYCPCCDYYREMTETALAPL